MFLIIGDVLSSETVKTLRRDIAQLSWRDGAETAGAIARQVKRNEQADLSDSVGTRVRKRLERSIHSHAVINSAARPARFSPFLISQTPQGGGYGTHVDNAFMGQGEARLRTDLSFTVFLSDPDEYEGGALVIDLPGARQEIKLKAGDCVLYPTSALHGVAEVMSGTRLVCVGWIESLVADAGDREILFDLENLKSALSEHYDPQSAERLTAQKVFSNLLRRFSR